MLLLYLNQLEDTGDKHKLEALYNNYAKLMKYYAYQILQDYDKAEDAVHDSFVKIIKCIRKIPDPSLYDAKNLVIRIVKNTAFDMMRKQKHESVQQLEISDFSLANFDVNTVFDEIKELPETYAHILLLKYYYGFSSKEIAVLESIPVSAVRKRLERAKQKLAQRLSFKEEKI